MSDISQVKNTLNQKIDSKVEHISNELTKLIDKIIEFSEFYKNSDKLDKLISIFLDEYLSADEITNNEILLLKLMDLLPYYSEAPTGADNYSDEYWLLVNSLGNVNFGLEDAACVSFKLFKVKCLDLEFEKEDEKKIRTILSELEELSDDPDVFETVNECHDYLKKLIDVHY